MPCSDYLDSSLVPEWANALGQFPQGQLMPSLYRSQGYSGRRGNFALTHASKVSEFDGFALAMGQHLHLPIKKAPQVSARQSGICSDPAVSQLAANNCVLHAILRERIPEARRPLKFRE
jgi:hypothetical protein